MALKKKIRIPNGLELEYHRIALLSIDVNNRITILRHSYLNKEARDYEKAYSNGEITGEPTFPYVDATYMYMEYLDDANVEKAYEYLKTLPLFEDAIDV